MTEELIKEAEEVAKDGLPNCNTNHEHYESCLTCENNLISMIQALVEALKAEKEKNTRATPDINLDSEQTPDYFYNVDNWESTYHELDLLEDEQTHSEQDIMKVGRLKSLPDKYMANVYNSEEDEYEYVLFDTPEEAKAAIKVIKENIT